MVQKKIKERVKSQGEWEGKNVSSLLLGWNEIGRSHRHVSCCAWCSLNEPAGFGLSSILTILKFPPVHRKNFPGNKNIKIQPSCPPSSPDHVPDFCVGHLGGQAAQETWKVGNTWGRVRMFSKLPIWFASPDSPDPWDVQKPSVCLFVPWRSPREPAERARWHRPAYKCRRGSELP